MHRFFISVDNIKDRTVFIDQDQARHIIKVLRLGSGDCIIGFDGTGYEYLIRLYDRQGKWLTGYIENKTVSNTDPLLKLNLVQGIAKGDKMDTIIQKAVEIGVSTIYPLISEYSVVRLTGEKAISKVERWQTIAREACKQCRRNIIPRVNPTIYWGDLFKLVGNNPVIMLYEQESGCTLKKILQDNQDQFGRREIFLLVGPEGGFSPGEAGEARTHGAYLAGLGPRILRTETAGLVGAAIIMYQYDELG